MNCQPGDLALIIRGFPQHIGKLVTCLESIPRGLTVHTIAGHALLMCDCPIWRIDRALSYALTNGVLVEVPFAADAALLPIRPERDEDHDLTQAASDELARRRPTYTRSPERQAR